MVEASRGLQATNLGPSLFSLVDRFRSSAKHAPRRKLVLRCSVKMAISANVETDPWDSTIMAFYAYKLVRVRRDGSIGPLFINRHQVIPVGKWVKAESHPTPGYKLRPGWHACHTPSAPHLSKKGRAWALVTLKGITKWERPKAQGGTWYTARWMKVETVGPKN
jgi:hypothetical protein